MDVQSSDYPGLPVAFRLEWSRYENPSDWMRAEIVCAKFDGEQPTHWAIREGGCCLTKEGLWEIEPHPSSRDDEYIARARYGSYTEAATHADKWIERRERFRAALETSDFRTQTHTHL